MEMVSNDLISKQIFPNLSSKKEVHEFTYAKINMFQEEKKKREIKIEMKIQLRPECTCMEFVPCSSFRNILKVFESVMRMRIFFYRASHRRFLYICNNVKLSSLI